jgi:hypothetical protein
MVEVTYCDVPGCKKEASYKGHQIDVCSGFTTSREEPGQPKKTFEPFTEGLNIVKRDLCTQHLKEWCEATYRMLYGDPKDAQY